MTVWGKEDGGATLFPPSIKKGTSLVTQ